MEWIWVVLLTTLLSFCVFLIYRAGYRRGYKAGANMVLKEWKTMMEKLGE